jgi:hypothetical protein
MKPEDHFRLFSFIHTKGREVHPAGMKMKAGNPVITVIEAI